VAVEDTSIAMDSNVVITSAPSTPEFSASDGYRRYVIWLLFTIYVFNFADRSILAVLVQPIKSEFALSDAQLGLLGGLAFALLYTTLGIPIARLADRSNRVNIITVSLFAWSLFTGLTGFATSFVQLLAARLAVGIGEAGCSPAAYSLIGDYFTKKRRATAAATYAMGISGGVFVGFVVATRIAHAYGWRAAFFAVGFPGVLLSVVVKLTLREPPRGFSDGISVTALQPPLGELLKKLWLKRAFRNLSLGAALSAFVAYGAGAFYPAFLMRSYGLTMMEVGARLGIVTALGGFIGAFLGGRLTDWFGNRSEDPRFQLWVPATALLINVPLGFLIYHVHSINAVLGLLLVVMSIGAMPLGPTYAAAQSLLLPRERALGAAVVLFVVNLVGLGFGPLATGFLSDAFHTHLLAAGQSDAAATAGGLVWALQAMIVINLWAAAHFFLGARTLRQDSVV
jgi:MFS family permease